MVGARERVCARDHACEPRHRTRVHGRREGRVGDSIEPRRAALCAGGDSTAGGGVVECSYSCRKAKRQANGAMRSPRPCFRKSRSLDPHRPFLDNAQAPRWRMRFLRRTKSCMVRSPPSRAVCRRYASRPGSCDRHLARPHGLLARHGSAGCVDARRKRFLPARRPGGPFSSRRPRAASPRGTCACSPPSGEDSTGLQSRNLALRLAHVALESMTRGFSLRPARRIDANRFVARPFSLPGARRRRGSSESRPRPFTGRSRRSRIRGRIAVRSPRAWCATPTGPCCSTRAREWRGTRLWSAVQANRATHGHVGLRLAGS